MAGRIKIIRAFIFCIFLAACSGKKNIDSGIELIPFRYDENGLWGFVDREGNAVIDTMFKNEPTYFREGYAIVETDSAVYDFIDENGSLQNMRLRHATLFSEGLACVVPRNEVPCYIDEDMDVVFKAPFAEIAGVFSEGLAKFQNNKGKWGYINKEGKIAITPSFHGAMSFRDGLALVANITKSGIMAGFIDKSGKPVIPMTNKYIILRPFRDSLSAFRTDSGWGYIDLKGETVIGPNPDWMETTDFFNGYASFRVDNYWGLIDKKGNIAVPPKYSLPLTIINGKAIFEDVGFFGYINAGGNIIIEPQFDGFAMPFFGEFALVKNEGEYFTIDKEGNRKNRFACKDVNAKYMKVFDIEETVVGDYFDVSGTAALILSDIHLNRINGIRSDAGVKDIHVILRCDSLSLKLDSTFHYAILTRDDEIPGVLKRNTKIEFKNYPSDSSSLESLEYRIKSQGKTIGKEQDIIDELAKKFLKIGFRPFAFNKRLFFESVFSNASIIQYYDEIIIRYEFQPEEEN